MSFMRRSHAAVGSVLFFLLAPGVVAVGLPWWLTGWRVHESVLSSWPVHVLGIALLVPAAGTLAFAFIRFVAEGLGTPAPVAPTDRLVVGGPYRYVRNPMYLAVVATIVGQALVLSQPSLLAYAAIVFLAVAAFVRWYEEPALIRQFGNQYRAYLREVPAWWPRRHAWRPDDMG